MGLGVVISKRSLGLSKSYLIASALISAYGIILSNLTRLIPSGTIPSGVSIIEAFPLISVPLLSLGALLISTPILMLFVYDKNNGVLEYLLSTGMDQIDLFTSYLRAALFSSTILLVITNALNAAFGLLAGEAVETALIVILLTMVTGLSVITLVTVTMMAFSSLQKTPMGANQPLGIVIGVVPIFPSFFLPLAFPSIAIFLEVLIAIIVLIVSLTFLFLSNKLIKREKFLP